MGQLNPMMGMGMGMGTPIQQAPPKPSGPPFDKKALLKEI